MNVFRRGTLRAIAALSVALFVSVGSAGAQDIDQPSSFLAGVFKQIVLDPTTYGPAVVSYTALRLDWQSSQVFFRHGFVEGNHRYTLSGLPNDLPLRYAVGNRQLVADALAMLQMSVVNNATTALFEHLLVRRYPEHRKLLRALSWVERIAFASYWSSRSADHLRQWQQNERLARQYGYK